MKRKQKGFLAAFGQTGNVIRAAEASGVSRSSHYRWLETDHAYRDAYEAAKEQAADVLEAEAIRRATEGSLRPTGWYQGQPGGYVREYSDELLILLLKGAKPEKYADRLHVRGALANIDISKLPDHLVQRIAEGEHPLAVLASAQPDHGGGTEKSSAPTQGSFT